MEVKKNDIFTVTITDTGNDGEGIGRVSVPDGKAPCVGRNGAGEYPVCGYIACGRAGRSRDGCGRDRGLHPVY